MIGAQVLGAITAVLVILGAILVSRGTREIGERRAQQASKGFKNFAS